MKTPQILLLTALVGALALAVGCGKKEEPAPVRREEVRPLDEVPAGEDEAKANDGTKTATSRKPPRKRGESLIHAPGDYLHIVTIDAPNKARNTAALAQLRGEIQAFNAMNERYPESLDEVKALRGGALPPLSKRFEYRYDPKTGSIEIVDLAQQQQ